MSSYSMHSYYSTLLSTDIFPITHTLRRSRHGWIFRETTVSVGTPEGMSVAFHPGRGLTSLLSRDKILEHCGKYGTDGNALNTLLCGGFDMKVEDLSRDKLQAELKALRKRVAELEHAPGSPDTHNSCGEEGTRRDALNREASPVQRSPFEETKTQEDYFSLVQNAGEAICITQDGMVKFVNRAGAQLTGYTEEELRSMAFAALVYPEDLEDLARIYMMRLRGEYVTPGHRFRIITATDEVKWVESWSATITWSGRAAVLSMIRDVTGHVMEEERIRCAHDELNRRDQERTAQLQALNERLIKEAGHRERVEQQARDSERRLQRLMENSPMGISVTTTQGEVEYLNKKFSELFGYTLNDIPTLDRWWSLAFPDPRVARQVKSEWFTAIRDARDKGTEAAPAEREVTCKDGEIRVIDFRKTVVGNQVIHTFLDVTEIRRQEEALIESEQMFRLLSEQSLMSVAVLQDGVYKYANEAMSDLCEYPLNEISNWSPDEFLEVVHPEDRTLVMAQARMKQYGDPRQTTHYAFRIVTKAGTTKWVEIYSKTVQFKGRPANLLTMLDITERKKAEQALRDTENRYRSLVEASPDPIIMYDLEGHIITVNQQAAVAYGVDSPEQLRAEVGHIFQILDQESQETAAEQLKRTLRTGASLKTEYTVVRKDDSTFPVEINSSLIRSGDGRPLAFISVVRDITDRKYREDELRKSRGIISSILNSVPQSIFWKDRDSVYLGCNTVFARAVGLQNPDEIVGKTDYDLPWPLEEADSYRAYDNEVMELNQPKHHIIEPLQQANGTRLWIDTSKIPLTDVNGTVYGVLGVYDDITDRKKAEEALRSLEDLYRNVIENIEDVFYRSDDQGRLLMGSPSGARLFGYDNVEEMIGLPLDSFWVDTRERDRLIADIRKSGRVKDFEGILKRKDGSTFVASFTTHFYRDESGTVRGTQGIIRDVTARKEAKIKLMLSEERLRLAWETSPDFFSISRLRDAMLVDVNKGFTEVTGYSREEAIGKSALDLNLWVNAPERKQLVHVVGEYGRARDFETKFRRKDGEIRTVSISVGLMDLDGEPHLLGIVKDIEESKRAQEALAKSEKLFRKYFELGLVGMALTSPEKGWVYVNDRICEMLGYTRDELVQTTWSALTHPDDLEPELVQFNRMLAGQIEGYSTDKRFVRKGGAVIHTTLHLTCMRHADGTVENVIAHLYDISDRKRAEESLQRYTQELETSVQQLKSAEESLSAGERLLRQVIDLVPHFIFAKDIQGRFILANNAVAEAYGTTVEALIGKTDGEYAKSDEEVLHFRSDDLEVITSGLPKAIAEEQITDAKGRIRWLSTMKIPFAFSEAREPSVLGVSVDITERRKAEENLEEALRRSRLQLETVSEIAVSSALVAGDTLTLAREITERGASALGVERVGVWLFSDDGETLMCIDLYEFSPSRHSSGIALNKEEFKNELDALETTRYVDAHDALSDPRTAGYVDTYLKPLHITSMLDVAIRRGRESRGVICFEHVDKTHLWQPDEIAFACQMADQFAIALHNHDRMAAEQAIRESELQYRLLAENISDVIWTMTTDLKLTYVSSSVERLFGWTPNEMLAFEPSDYLAPGSLDRALNAFEKEISVDGTPGVDPNRVVTVELEQFRSDGSTFWTEVSSRFLYDDSGGLVGVIGATRDITDRKRSEEELHRLFAAVEQAGETIMITELDGKVLYVNPAFEKTTGYPVEEVLGRTPEILNSGKHNRAFYEELWSTITRGEIWRGRFTNRKRDGSLFEETATISPIKDQSGQPVYYVMVGRDVTSEILLQKQLHQAQKMEAIGTLAGGIAHDFNNLLQAILGYSDLLLMGNEMGDKDRKKVQVIHQAARDGADLVSRILTFSRKADSKVRPVDLNEEIRKAQTLLRRTIPRMIDIKVVLADNLSITDADPAQIEQILLNLAVNAHHAMPDGGRLLIETDNVELADEYLLTHLGAQPGSYVLLTVSDTGKGIEQGTVDRIFEPFFTTKTNGEGTGLGLSMVHGIVAQHGGYIKCYSEPGRGTSFRIYFPVSATESVPDPTLTQELPSLGTETVLLVDDDERIREMGRQMIETGGYKVITACNGEEALEIYRDLREEISLVILDLIMPGIGGNRCLKELIRIDPDVRVLIASGYSSNGISDKEKQAGAKGFISKPYEAKKILGAVRKVLDEGQL